MSMYPDQTTTRRPVELDYAAEKTSPTFRFFNQVYAWMAVGLAVTACVAMLFSRSPALMSALYANKFVYIAIILGLVALAWAVQGAALRISAAAGTALFILYAAMMGAVISYIFLVYQASTIYSAFFLTAGTFAAMSLYGFVTKRDLTTIGSFAVMAVMGLFLASLVNVFMRHEAMSWVITYGVLLAFIVLTAYDTQKLKQVAHTIETQPELASRLAIIGSLNLYIDFINIFLAILRILGSRK
jgi:uncharacterized protein